MTQTVYLAAAALPPASRGPLASQRPLRPASLRPPDQSASLPAAPLRRLALPAAAMRRHPPNVTASPAHRPRPPASAGPWSAATL
eukprot:4503023-Prymnesium_polylepis.1